jgi:hypothetical protein
VLRGLGPYAAIELLLPGGSVIALLIWLYRHRAGRLDRSSSPAAPSAQYRRTHFFTVVSEMPMA